MKEECWQIGDNGFLMSPLHSFTGYLAVEIAERLDSLMLNLANLLETGEIRNELDRLPVYELSVLDNCHVLERAFQVYAYFASTYIYATGQEAVNRLPSGIAIPLVQLAEKLQRPPILSYAPYTLGNWQKIDTDGEIVVDNLKLLHKFIHKRDAEWFTIIHVDIEARAGQAIMAVPKIKEDIKEDNPDVVIHELESIHESLANMMATLKRMPEHCHPTVYYHEVRPYIMSFTDVIYEGVEKFKGLPQSFAGETGAQSSVIPALIRFMGLSHEENSMTRYLTVMQDYMPEPHRNFIQEIQTDMLRNYVKDVRKAPLSEAYNHTLEQILEFRKLHIRYASSYIANQSPDSVGTGGTEFMTWLQRLIDETEAQFLS